MFEQYAPVLIFAVIAIAFPLVTLWIGKLIRPTSVDEGAKLDAYECGVEPESDARGRYTVRYYIIVDGLLVARYLQQDSRFLGSEAGIDFKLHSKVRMNLGMDYVDAQLTPSGAPLPRIPPLRGRVGFVVQHKNLYVKPELVLASDQDQHFSTETRTAGYTLINLKASYTVSHSNLAHIFAVNAFNLGNRLYRNHLSFIKNLAPEIGRGIRFTYSVRFF